MAKKEKEIVDVNQLWRLKDGQKGKIESLFYGHTDIQVAYVKRDWGVEKVFNRAMFTLSIPDNAILIEPSGVEAPIDYASYKTDFGGEKSYISAHITWNPELQPNEKEEEVRGTYTIKQEISELELTGNYIQAPNFETVVYSDLAITNVNYMNIPAYGGKSTIVIGYSATKTTVYASGLPSKSEPIGGTVSTFEEITGRRLIDGATFNSSNGEVEAENLLANPTQSDTKVAEVTYVKISLFDMDAYWYGTAYCYQNQNKETIGTPRYIVSCVAEVNDCASIASSIDFEVAATKIVHYSYSSGSEYDKESDATATMSTDLGNIKPIYITGRGTATLTLDANTGSERTATVKATCADGTSASDYVTQASDSVREEWGVPTILAIYCSLDIPANGMGVPITAKYTQNKYRISQATGTEIIDTDEGTVVVSSAVGTNAINGAVIEGSLVSANSLGTTIQNRRSVITITSVSVTANKVTGTSSGLTCKVYQEANAIVDTITRYELSLSASGSPISVFGGNATINVSAKSIANNTYTSGDSKDVTSNATAKITTKSNTAGAANGTLGASSITGVGSTTFNIAYENLNISKNSHTVTASCGDQSKSVSIEQSGSVYVFDIMSLSPSVSASGGVVSLTIKSTRNGNPQSFTTEDVSISGLSGVSKSVTDNGGGMYSVILDVPSNGSTSDRTFSVSVTQPNSLYSDSIDITQLGAVDERDDVFIRLTASASDDYSTVSYSVQFQATNTNQYKGGTLNNVYVRLGSSETGGTLYAEKLLSSRIVVAEGSSSQTYTGTLDNTGGSGVWVLVYYNNGLQKAVKPMVIMT